MARKILALNATENGNYPAGGTTLTATKNFIAVVGEFDGATIGIEITVDGVNWTSVNYETGTPLAITSATQDTLWEFLPTNYSVRAVISGAGASTDLSVYVSG
jgi:phospholipase C